MTQVQSSVPWGWEQRQQMDALAFPEAEYQERINRLRGTMSSSG